MVDVALIVAISDNNIIGKAGALPWKIPAEMAYFRKTTWGKPVIMGHSTFKSLAKPLEGRTNLVLSRNPHCHCEGARVFSDFRQCLEYAGKSARESGADEIMIIGGRQIYTLALPLVNRIYLTLVHQFVDGDCSFPPWDRSEWRIVSQKEMQPIENIPAYSLLKLER